MSAYSRDFDKTKYISFEINDGELFENTKKLGKKLKQYQKKFQTETAYNKKHVKAKPKSFNVNTNTNFLNDKITKECSQFVYLSVTLINSVFKTGYNCYPQVFQKNVKELIKKKRCLSIILMTQKFLLILIENILMRKIKNICYSFFSIYANGK